VKRNAKVFALVVFSLVIFLPFTFNMQVTYAQDTNYTIEQVNHNIEVLHSDRKSVV
jgi:hypothetical protein